ncbi:hypothetical protein U5N28_09205 [Lysinibacillus telephonicus]|uniref:DUF1795 domain-containing protein n=1 Tax=Lysinibacillus telephonicus TaxID=1714840 RepID=A0A3S0JJB0_9BACI|nr:hypothetical protein [Lysinibacillus telephonicus]RTQ89361.1 hypothetical protein EKG35_16560 [Lysinibacillus telephonicus]
MKKRFIGFFSTVLFGTLLLVGCGSKEADTTQEEQEQEVEAPTNEGSEQQQSSEDETIETSQSSVNEENNEVISTSFEGVSFNIPNYAEKLDLGEQQLPVDAYMLDSSTGTSFNIVLEPLAEPLSLEEYMKYATANTGFEYLSDEYYTSNDIEWNEVVSLNHTEQGTLKLNQRTFIIDNQVFIFTYASTPESYDQLLQDFNAITESVKVSN